MKKYNKTGEEILAEFYFRYYNEKIYVTCACGTVHILSEYASVTVECICTQIIFYDVDTGTVGVNVDGVTSV